MVGGIQGYPIITRPDASYDWQEHFTAIKGNHTIKLGGQFQDAYHQVAARPGAHWLAILLLWLRRLRRQTVTAIRSSPE